MRLLGAALTGVLTGTLVVPVTAPASGATGAVGSSDRARPVVVGMRGADRAGLREGSWLLARGATRVRADFSMVAVTWTGTQVPRVRLRAHDAGGWQPWQPVEALGDLGAKGTTRGSEPIWTGESDGLQVRVSGPTRGARLVLVDPGADPAPAPRRTPAASSPRAAAKPPTHAPRPGLHGRKDWGAKERWRNGGPRYNDKLKQVHLHHTVNSNNYKRSEVRGILRSIYRYHTHNLGWSDIGYNFLVDRFGRAWVGRAGGADRLVRGAHTLGFNHSSTGIAVIGNFETATPRADVVTTLVRLAAWKLDRYDRKPDGKTWVTSQGSDLYRRGKRVKLPVIDGHRDTNQTACPGQNLYDLLPQIRKRAAHRAARFS